MPLLGRAAPDDLPQRARDGAPRRRRPRGAARRLTLRTRPRRRAQRASPTLSLERREHVGGPLVHVVVVAERADHLGARASRPRGRPEPRGAGAPSPPCQAAPADVRHDHHEVAGIRHAACCRTAAGRRAGAAPASRRSRGTAASLRRPAAAMPEARRAPAEPSVRRQRSASTREPATTSSRGLSAPVSGSTGDRSSAARRRAADGLLQPGAVPGGDAREGGPVERPEPEAGVSGLELGRRPRAATELPAALVVRVQQSRHRHRARESGAPRGSLRARRATRRPRRARPQSRCGAAASQRSAPSASRSRRVHARATTSSSMAASRRDAGAVSPRHSCTVMLGEHTRLGTSYEEGGRPWTCTVLGTMGWMPERPPRDHLLRLPLGRGHPHLRRRHRPAAPARNRGTPTCWPGSGAVHLFLTHYHLDHVCGLAYLPGVLPGRDAGHPRARKRRSTMSTPCSRHRDSCASRTTPKTGRTWTA